MHMKNLWPKMIRLLLLVMIGTATYRVGAQTLQVGDTVTTSCNNDGSTTLRVYGGTAPYTYTLTGYYNVTYGPVTQTSNTFAGLPAGYYQAVVSDANGVSNITQPLYIYIPSRISGYVSVYPAVCPSTLGSEKAFGYTNNGSSGSFTYLWSTGATTDSIYNVPVGTHYQCTVTEVSTGCTVLASDSGSMYQISSIQPNVTTTAANCRNGTATTAPTNGISPYSYIWSNGNATATATNLSAGYATVTVTDAIGCSAQGYGYISQAIQLTSQVNTTAEHCNDGNGTLSISPVNGTSPFTYTWSSGQTTAHITNLNAGYYQVTFTDHNGCTGVNYGQVQKSTPISLTTSTTLTSCSSPTGSATVVATGGTAPYTYSWNTYPPQATATASALTGGYYVVNVVDAQGCFQNQSAQVGFNTNLSISTTHVDAHCGGTPGSASASVSGGTGPYTLLWSNGATGTSISNLTQQGYYTCAVTDNAGCHSSSSTYMQSISPVSLSVSTAAASCIYTSDGSATAIVSGGTAPYTYSWGASSSVTGLAQGDYTLYVHDANGCGAFRNYHIGYASTAPCAVIIAGDIIEDDQRNCNVQFTHVDNVWVSCQPGGGYQWSQNGHYQFTLPPGTYTVYEAPPVNYTLACPATSPTLTLTAGQSSLNNDFFNQPDTARDLAITCIPYTPPVHGFTQHSRLIIRNLGNIMLGPDVVYKHALDINFHSASPAPDSYDPTTGILKWSRPSLVSTATDEIDLYFDIPAPLPIGHILNNSDTVYPIDNDIDTFNNYEDAQGLVVGSYDPNYVDVLPKGSGAPGYITTTTDTTLRYVVHFQNTGTYPATYVTLKLPIDNNLDLSTFQFIGASHTVTSISADAARILTIRFDNIHLVDSSVSQLGSQGFAAFTLRQKRGLNPGNVINEQANIYFDFNTPVATNTTLNTIHDPNGITEIAVGSLGIYPNPTQGNATLDLSGITEDRIQVRAYDMMGRLAMEVPSTDIAGKKQLLLNTAALPAGVYSIEVSGQSRYVAKLVKTDK